MGRTGPPAHPPRRALLSLVGLAARGLWSSWGGPGAPAFGARFSGPVPRSVFSRPPPVGPLVRVPVPRCLSAVCSGGPVGLRRGRFFFRGCCLVTSPRLLVKCAQGALGGPPVLRAVGLQLRYCCPSLAYRCRLFPHHTLCTWGRTGGPLRRFCGALNSPEIVNRLFNSNSKRHF